MQQTFKSFGEREAEQRKRNLSKQVKALGTLIQTRQLGQMLLKSLVSVSGDIKEDSANDTNVNFKELDVGILNGETLTLELSLNDCNFIGP